MRYAIEIREAAVCIVAFYQLIVADIKKWGIGMKNRSNMPDWLYRRKASCRGIEMRVSGQNGRGRASMASSKIENVSICHRVCWRWWQWRGDKTHEVVINLDPRGPRACREGGCALPRTPPRARNMAMSSSKRKRQRKRRAITPM